MLPPAPPIPLDSWLIYPVVAAEFGLGVAFGFILRFVFAAIDESGGQLTAAGATAAGLGTAWSAGFATITSRLRSIETASTSAR